ncbi:helix-turn-helix domain-containing protein [Micromonospora sp. CA-263727]|uniref:helix-turn-helix domain-containing protein n=1 Tax=Micromonospora sp. CA-263727 TaxID=3239967 RepID=UPI003D94483A
MPPRAHSIVDPRFPAELARLRHERGLSLRDLARQAYVGKSYVHDLETGRTRPSRELAEHLDDTLQAVACSPPWSPMGRPSLPPTTSSGSRTWSPNRPASTPLRCGCSLTCWPPSVASMMCCPPR